MKKSEKIMLIFGVAVTLRFVKFILAVIAIAAVVYMLTRHTPTRAEQFTKDPVNISIYEKGETCYGLKYRFFKKDCCYTEITCTYPNGDVCYIRNMDSIREDPCMVIGNHPEDVYEWTKGESRIRYSQTGIARYYWTDETHELDEGLSEGTEIFRALWKEILTKEGYI